MENVDSTDRKPVDFVLFGLGFLGFILLDAGVVISVAPLALLGGLMLLLCILSFGLRSSPGKRI